MQQWGVYVPGAALSPGQEQAAPSHHGPGTGETQQGQSGAGHSQLGQRRHDQLPVPHVAQLVSELHCLSISLL